MKGRKKRSLVTTTVYSKHCVSPNLKCLIKKPISRTLCERLMYLELKFKVNVQEQVATFTHSFHPLRR